MGFLKGSQTSYKPHLVHFSLILEDVRRCQDHTFFSFLLFPPCTGRIKFRSVSDETCLHSLTTRSPGVSDVFMNPAWYLLNST